jgi:hypothetical protein
MGTAAAESYRDVEAQPVNFFLNFLKFFLAF